MARQNRFLLWEQRDSLIATSRLEIFLIILYHSQTGVSSDLEPLHPIPNWIVKRVSGDDSLWATGRENSSMPVLNNLPLGRFFNTHLAALLVPHRGTAGLTLDASIIYLTYGEVF